MHHKSYSIIILWSQVGRRKHHYEKASGGDGIPVELFQILKDDALKLLHSICQQIWKTQQWPQDWKKSVFIPIPKKGNAKKCSNYHTIVLISHASKVMLKILQARLQQYMNRELSDVQAHIEKSEEVKLCLTLSDPMDGSPPGFSYHGVFQARILGLVAIFFSRGSSWPTDWTRVSPIAGRLFASWATRESQPEVTLPTSVGSSKKQESFRKTSPLLTPTILLYWTITKLLTVWMTTNCGKFLKWWEYQTTWPASWEIFM